MGPPSRIVTSTPPPVPWSNHAVVPVSTATRPRRRISTPREQHLVAGEPLFPAHGYRGECSSFLLRVGLLVAALTLITVSACDADDGDPLAGRSFVSEEVGGNPPLPDATIYLGFERGEVNFDAACNAHFAPYEVEGDKLTITTEYFGATEIGCDAPRHEQDSWFADFLLQSPTFELNEARLTLSAENTAITFVDREVAFPDQPLKGTVWNLEAFISMNTVGFPASWPDTPLVFAEDGTFSIDMGCPTASGEYAATGKEITFANVTTVTDGCEASDDFGQGIAAAVITDGTVRYEIKESRLTIERGDEGLTFSAQ